MTESKRAVIVGGGHNGLICATYLAKAGFEVQVLEASENIGGAAVTRGFGEGFKVSACAHLLHLLDETVIQELDLTRHGLDLTARGLNTIALSENGDHLTIAGATLTGGGITDADRNALLAFNERMARFADLLRDIYRSTPPRLGGRLNDAIALLKLGKGIRQLGRQDMREFLRIVGINIHDVLEERFASDLLKGSLAFDAVLGTHLGPRSNNSVLSFLHRLTGRIRGERGSLLIPPGGMGTLSAAIAKAAQAAGASVRVQAPVSRIVLDNGSVTGVELDGGEKVNTRLVVSNADPHVTFFELVGAANLETEFARRIKNVRMRGNAAKLHLGLEGIPEFTGLAAGSLGARLIIAPSLTYLEQAFDHAKYGEYSNAPAIEMIFPSVLDASLAPSGQHVMSAIVQYAPYQLQKDWEAAREDFMNIVIDRISEFCPGLRQQVVSAELLSPRDIEAQFRMTGGHWHHGELALDQFLMLRPAPGAAQYATPVKGLFLCGAGAHPGGGVMGLPGRNAAKEILAKRKAA